MGRALWNPRIWTGLLGHDAISNDHLDSGGLMLAALGSRFTAPLLSCGSAARGGTDERRTIRGEGSVRLVDGSCGALQISSNRRRCTPTDKHTELHYGTLVCAPRAARDGVIGWHLAHAHAHAPTTHRQPRPPNPRTAFACLGCMACHGTAAGKTGQQLLAPILFSLVTDHPPHPDLPGNPAHPCHPSSQTTN